MSARGKELKTYGTHITIGVRTKMGGVITLGWFLHNSVHCTLLKILCKWKRLGPCKLGETRTEDKLVLKLYRRWSKDLFGVETTRHYLYHDTTEYWERRETSCRLSVFVPLWEWNSTCNNLGFEEIITNSQFSFIHRFYGVRCVHNLYKSDVKVTEEKLKHNFISCVVFTSKYERTGEPRGLEIKQLQGSKISNMFDWYC